MMLTLFEEAELKGRTEGRTEGTARALLLVLKNRFGSTSSTIEKKVSKITSLEQLTILLERVLYCESLKSFSNSLK